MAVQEHQDWQPGAWTELRVDVLSKDQDAGTYMVRHTNLDGSFVDFEIKSAGTLVNLPSPTGDDPVAPDPNGPVPEPA